MFLKGAARCSKDESDKWLLFFIQRAPESPQGHCGCVCFCGCVWRLKEKERVCAQVWGGRERDSEFKHAKARLLPWPADVFVTPDIITYYVFLFFFWQLPLLLSLLTGKSNVVRGEHVSWNNGSKILNKEWKGARVWMTIGRSLGVEGWWWEGVASPDWW